MVAVPERGEAVSGPEGFGGIDQELAIEFRDFEINLGIDEEEHSTNSLVTLSYA